jgi:hypothetical protein
MENLNMRAASLFLMVGVALMAHNSKLALAQDNFMTLTNDFKDASEVVVGSPGATESVGFGQSKRVVVSGPMKLVTVTRVLPSGYMRTYTYSATTPGCSNSVAKSVATFDEQVEYTGQCTNCSTLVACSGGGGGVSTDSQKIQRPLTLYTTVLNNTPYAVNYASQPVPTNGGTAKVQSGSPDTLVVVTRPVQNNKTRTYTYSVSQLGCMNKVQDTLAKLDARADAGGGSCCPCRIPAPDCTRLEENTACVDTK